MSWFSRKNRNEKRDERISKLQDRDWLLGDRPKNPLSYKEQCELTDLEREKHLEQEKHWDKERP